MQWEIPSISGNMFLTSFTSDFKFGGDQCVKTGLLIGPVIETVQKVPGIDGVFDLDRDGNIEIFSGKKLMEWDGDNFTPFVYTQRE
jgi:hypothetical protein